MRRFVRTAIFGVGLLGLTAVAPWAISEAAVAHSKSYAYGSHVRQALDAYWNDPKSGTQPGLVLIHGGYWNSGGRGAWKATAQWYSNQGFAVFSIDHRYDTDAPWPTPRDDASAALKWIKSHASTFRLDPDRVAVLGSQGGGQLAAQLGTRGAGNANVRGVIGLSPIVSPLLAYDSAQTSAASEERRKVRDQTVILGNCTPAYSEKTCLARYADADPGSAASADDAPMYLVHSDEDVISVEQSVRLRDALVAQGVGDVSVRTVDGDASGGALLTDSLRAQTLVWLRAHTAPRVSAPKATVARERPEVRDERSPARTTSDDGAVISAPQARVQGTRIESSYSYGSHPRQKLTAYYYKRTYKQPAIVMIHGGYWYEGDKSSWAAQARWFSDKGYAVFAINYRLNTQAPWPAQRSDVLSAINWVKARAGTFTLDPARVVLMGSSAGGHLATSVGVHGSGGKTVKAVVGLSPASNPYLGYLDGQASNAKENRRKLRDTAVLLARCTPEKADAACWGRWRDMVSYNQAGSGDAPMYLVFSKGDFVPNTNATQLCAELTGAGVSCAVPTVEGSDHGMALFNIAGVRDGILKWVQAHD